MMYSNQLIFEGQEKRKRKKGAQKKGGENSPVSPPLDPRLNCKLLANEKTDGDYNV